MSAETLRRAAALMRERAEAATPGPCIWECAIEDAHTVMPPDYAIWMSEVGHDGALVETEPDAQHIASWHPAVALAVADWLEAEAEAHRVDLVGPFPSACCRMSQALAVARVYLGESA